MTISFSLTRLVAVIRMILIIFYFNGVMPGSCVPLLGD